MAISEDYVQYIIDQLSEFGELHHKKMFGGVGFFREGKMFGLIGHDIFHLKADDTNKDQYESRGMKRFLADEKTKGLPYYEVPIEVIEDPRMLADWAMQSWEIAMGK